jgi:pimeloyl-ACP methyl ester carboxylesterase
MKTVSSRDGTTIGYDKVGDGPALILVDGALTVHSSGGKSELAGLLAAGFTVYGYDRRGRGEALFMRLIGTPGDQVEGMRHAPFWPSMEAIAPTLAYDHAGIIGEQWSAPTGLAARVEVPALVIAGGASLPFMIPTAQTLSKAMPQGQLRILEGQTHSVDPSVLAPVLTDFFIS